MSAQKPLKPKYRELLNYIGVYRKNHKGKAPTLKEMASALNYLSTSSIHRMLDVMARDGYIDRRAHHARAVEIARRKPAEPNIVIEITHESTKVLSADPTLKLEIIDRRISKQVIDVIVSETPGDFARRIVNNR